MQQIATYVPNLIYQITGTTAKLQYNGCLHNRLSSNTLSHTKHINAICTESPQRSPTPTPIELEVLKVRRKALPLLQTYTLDTMNGSLHICSAIGSTMTQQTSAWAVFVTNITALRVMNDSSYLAAL